MVCTGQEAISWADLIVLAAKVAHVQSWTAQKVKRASVAQDGSTIAEAFGAAFPVPLGRVDATSPDAPVQLPTQTASPADVKVGVSAFRGLSGLMGKLKGRESAAAHPRRSPHDASVQAAAFAIGPSNHLLVDIDVHD